MRNRFRHYVSRPELSQHEDNGIHRDLVLVRKMNAEAPEGFESFDDYCRYRLEGHGSLPEAAAKVIEAITYCREQGKRRLLADVSRWTGHSSPSAAERFDWAELFAAAAGPAVKCAMVVDRKSTRLNS